MYIVKHSSLLLAAIITCGANASSDATKPATEEAKLLKSIIKAKAIRRAQPIYPQFEAQNSHEGWVRVSYVIEADGTVSNAFVTDSSGIKQFERSTLKAVKRWKFEPATQNGKPTQQCENSLHMTFSLEGQSGGIRVGRKFRSAYKSILDALATKDHVAAEQQLAKMSKRKRFNLLEDRLHWQLNAYYNQAIGDDLKALKYFERANYDISGDKGNHLLNTRENIFLLTIQNNLLADALNAYEQIETSDNNEEVIARLQPLQQKVVQLIDSKNIIKAAETIGERGFTHYRLARSKFQIGQVEGNLSKIDVLCDNKKILLAIQPPVLGPFQSLGGNARYTCTATRVPLLVLLSTLKPANHPATSAPHAVY